MAGETQPGIKILSVLSYVLVFVLLFLTYLTFQGAGSYLGLIFILLAVLFFFIGKGLGRTQKWARIVAIILSLGLLAYGVFQLFGELRIMQVGILNIVVSCLILGYLLLNKKVRSSFN